MCRVLGGARSRFYDWLQAKPSAHSQEDERLKVAIKAAHQRTRQAYGSRRLQPELAADGFIAGRDRIARSRHELGLRCIQKRKFKATTNSKHNFPVAENLLNQNFAPSRPNEVWSTDITYISTAEGWLFLAGIKDLCSCEIVGYAMGNRMTKELTAAALVRAVRQKQPPRGLIHHSDRGSQYCAHEYRRLVDKFRMTASMSRKGNCYDNAPVESFWGSLKNVLIHGRSYATRAEAEASIREYIEIFYNRQRRHSTLGYVSPAVFTQNFNSQRAAA